MLFKTSLDKTAVTITIIFTVLFAFIIGVVCLTFTSGDSLRSIFIAIILLLLYCLAFAFHPSGYKITGDALIICRPIWNVQIKRTSIKSITVVDKKEISGAIRTFGVGGLFGYYGCFANYTLGSMTWYATRRDKAVLITRVDNKKIVITPNEPERFVAAFNA